LADGWFGTKINFEIQLLPEFVEMKTYCELQAAISLVPSAEETIATLLPIGPPGKLFEVQFAPESNDVKKLLLL
jgi:hypothetical protein